MALTFGSLFSGIGGFGLGFERAGMACKWQVEIDVKCRDVLSKHFQAEIFNDVKTVGRHNLQSVDVICGGFPCQDLSVAGKRAGLAGERSGLWFEFARIIDELEPGWVVIENVPGLLSSDRGGDFAVIIQWLVKRGYGVAWRILDAQYFGVAQRRRRVFIVASLGSGRAAEILFEREGMFGDTPTRREAGAAVAHAITQGPSSGYRYDPNGETFAISGYGQYSQGLGTLRSNGGDLGGGSEMLTAFNIQHNDGGDHKRKDRPNGGMYVNETETALTVGTTDLTAIAWDKRQITSKENRSQPRAERTPTLNGNGEMMVGVRRLTPTECARLQGFPDDWNDWLADNTRYRQFGNAVCVNVLEWIGRQLMQYLEVR